MSMSAQDVAVYLQENPAFFDENAELWRIFRYRTRTTARRFR